MSVRDEYTADVLAKFGIKNTIVTGCPSNFINLDPRLGAKIIEKTAHRKIQKIGIKYARISPKLVAATSCPSTC